VKKIISIEKRKKGYMVSFEHETFLVFPEVYIKHHLKPGLELTDEDFLAFMEDHMWMTYLDMGLNKLRKMMTVQEMRTFLIEKGAKEGLVKQLIFYMIDRKYLNDMHYVKTYIELKKYQEGPLMIAHKLKDKGISDALIESYVFGYDEKQVLYTLISKKIQSETKKSKKQTLIKLKETYLKKGFNLEIVESLLHELSHLYQGDEKALLEKDYQKIKQKLMKHYEGYDLKKLLKEKLYQKGYALDEIKEIMREDE
jgi:regulatory protein